MTRVESSEVKWRLFVALAINHAVLSSVLAIVCTYVSSHYHVMHLLFSVLAVESTGNPVAMTVMAISPFMLSSTSAPNIMLALGSTAS